MLFLSADRQDPVRLDSQCRHGNIVCCCVAERLRLSPGPVYRVMPDHSLLVLWPAVVRGGHRPVHQPREQPEEGVPVLSTWRAAKIPRSQVSVPHLACCSVATLCAAIGFVDSSLSDCPPYHWRHLASLLRRDCHGDDYLQVVGTFPQRWWFVSLFHGRGQRIFFHFSPYTLSGLLLSTILEQMCAF